MNKIIVKNNIVNNYQDDTIKIEDNIIKVVKDSDYEIEYIDCDKVELIINIINSRVNIMESSFDNTLEINNIYNINNGGVKINKFYTNEGVKEKIVVNLNKEEDYIYYNFSSITKGIEEYIMDINHNAKNTLSNISNKLVALKNSKINFTINSNVYKECNGSILEQNTRIVTMDKCDAKIQPNMFIDLDDVEARHGSVIGTFKDDQIFYLMSKGISYNDTLKLLIKGYLLGNVMVNFDVRKKIIDIIDMYWR